MTLPTSRCYEAAGRGERFAVERLTRDELTALNEARLHETRANPVLAHRRRVGLRMLVDWLEQAEGETWQQRWEAVGEDLEVDWQAAAGANNETQRHGLTLAFKTRMCHRIIRPSYERLFQLHGVSEELRQTTDRDDFARVIDVARRSETTGHAVSGALTLLARVLVRTGKRMGELKSDDLLGYAECVRARGAVPGGLYTAHELLCTWDHRATLDDPQARRSAAAH